MLHCVVRCVLCVVFCWAVCCALWCCALCSVVLCVVLCCAVCCALLCCVALCCIVLCAACLRVVLRCVVLILCAITIQSSLALTLPAPLWGQTAQIRSRLFPKRDSSLPYKRCKRVSQKQPLPKHGVLVFHAWQASARVDTHHRQNKPWQFHGIAFYSPTRLVRLK